MIVCGQQEQDIEFCGGKYCRDMFCVTRDKVWKQTSIAMVTSCRPPCGGAKKRSTDPKFQISAYCAMVCLSVVIPPVAVSQRPLRLHPPAAPIKTCSANLAHNSCTKPWTNVSFNHLAVPTALAQLSKI